MPDQLSIFDAITRADADFARTHAARNDPATSQAAALRARGMAHEHCNRIEEALRRMPQGGTAHEIADAIGLNNVQVARRMRDMAKAGRVFEADQTRPSPSGRPETVWKAADAAKESA